LLENIIGVAKTQVCLLLKVVFTHLGVTIYLRLKAMNSLKLPQFSRLFSAQILPAIFWITLWGITSYIIGINVTYLRKQQPVDPFRIAVLNHPESSEFHIRLARLYLINGYSDDAKREMSLIQTSGNPESAPKNSSQSATVLGTQVAGADLLTAWQRESLDQLGNYIYWKTVAEDKPDFISAKVMTAGYALSLGKINEADSLINQAALLDPTNIDVNQMKQQLAR
jgi:hypothetical protein